MRGWRSRGAAPGPRAWTLLTSPGRPCLRGLGPTLPVRALPPPPPHLRPPPRRHAATPPHLHTATPPHRHTHDTPLTTAAAASTDKWNGTAWIKVFGSIDDSVNEARIHAFDNNQQPASSAFSANQATVFAADINVFNDISASLTALGVPSVNWLRIPAGGWGGPTVGQPPGAVTMGVAQTSNTFTLLFRIGVVQDPVAQAQYVQSLPQTVIRVTRSSAAPARSPSLVTPVQLIPRATSNNEAALQAAQTALVAAVTAQYSANYSVTQIASVSNLLGANVDYGGICYFQNLPCNGDNRDAQYSGTAGTAIFTRATDINVVVGVNHRASGMATYSNLVIYNTAGQVGVVGVNDDQYQGSADAFLASTAYASVSGSLYAYTFARDCSRVGPYCAVVPSSGFPSVPPYAPTTPPSGVGLFIDRAYVHPVSLVGPATGAVLPPVHLRFSLKPCVNNLCQNGATCVNGVNTYTCVCAPGYSGATCATVIDNCASAPCQNGGTCTNVIGAGTFTCACAPDYTDATCSTFVGPS